MNAPVKTSTFMSGNSVALRLPKAFGIGPGERIEIEKQGDTVKVKILSEAEGRRAKYVEFVRRMRELGPAGGNPDDGRIEFPDRPGLY